MRIGIAISVVIHAMILLWLVLGPGARALNSASAEPIMVDLVSPQDAAKDEAQETKPEQNKAEQRKAEQDKPDPSQADPSKPDPTKPDPTKPWERAPDPPLSEVWAAAEKQAQERAAANARLAWLLDLPTASETSLQGPPSDLKSNLTSDEIASFKAQIAKCWVVPRGVPNTPGFVDLIRVAFRPDGRLAAKPELIGAPPTTSDAGIVLRDEAMQALRRCQPYTALPSAKYSDWKMLDITFTADGPARMAGADGGAPLR